jgi:hypothetical protein
MGARAGGGRHRKSTQTTKRERRRQHRSVARVRDTRRPVTSFVAAGAAVVAAASVTSATPIAAAADATVPAPREVSRADLQLAAASSPLNIPINFLIDLVNIPQYEVDGMNYEAAAFYYTGSWWVSNATNVWGTDPGDPPKYLGASQMLLPNPWLANYVGTTLSAIATAELPVNATCGTTQCKPFVPWDDIGTLAALLGFQPIPIINNFFTLNLSKLYTGYTFDSTAPGQQSFGGFVPTNPFGDEYPLAGTKTGPDGTYLQPWAGDTVNLTDFTGDSWDAYVAHLMSDPKDNPISLPSGKEIFRALTNLFAAAVVSFDPFTPGMSYCPNCVWPNAITPEGIVGALLKVDPGNTLMAAWLDNHAWQNSQGAPGGTATPSTPESVQAGKGTSSQTNLTFAQIVQHDLKTIAGQFFGDYGSPAVENPPSGGATTMNALAAADTTSGQTAPTDPAPAAQQQGKHARTLDPFAAVTPSSPRTPTGARDASDSPHPFADRINDAVARTIGAVQNGGRHSAADKPGGTLKLSDLGKRGKTGDNDKPGAAAKAGDNDKPGADAKAGDDGKPKGGNGSGDDGKQKNGVKSGNASGRHSK